MYRLIVCLVPVFALCSGAPVPDETTTTESTRLGVGVGLGVGINTRRAAIYEDSDRNVHPHTDGTPSSKEILILNETPEGILDEENPVEGTEDGQDIVENMPPISEEGTNNLPEGGGESEEIATGPEGSEETEESEESEESGPEGNEQSEETEQEGVENVEGGQQIESSNESEETEENEVGAANEENQAIEEQQDIAEDEPVINEQNVAENQANEEAEAIGNEQPAELVEPGILPVQEGVIVVGPAALEEQINGLMNNCGINGIIIFKNPKENET